MVTFPPCKINLGLNVIEKRSDGYHNLETCFYPIPFTDILEILVSEKVSFTPSGHTIPGNESDNLCIKAYELLKSDFPLAPVEIHLHKVIPTGAGLGGGSSDAAHTLRLLNLIFELKLTNEQLKRYAQQLGSDCAFFIDDVPMIGTGRGEVLESVSLSLKGKFLVLLKPDVHVSTVEAYKGIVPYKSNQSVKNIVEHTPLSQWRHTLKNDFEDSVFAAHSPIARCKTDLYDLGAAYAGMSGSGAAVFGIFDKELSVDHPLQLWSGIL